METQKVPFSLYSTVCNQVAGIKKEVRWRTPSDLHRYFGSRKARQDAHKVVAVLGGSCNDIV